MPKENPNDVFYVGIRQPTELRRGVLGCSKKIIQSLKRYENLRRMREEKMEQISKLKRTISEISFLTGKLRSSLPQTKLRALDKQRKEAIAKTNKQKKIIRSSITKHRDEELARLEEELAAIENKIGPLE